MFSKRYYDASKVFKADIIVRITGDSILIDARLVDKIIKIFKSNKVDYVSNCEPPTFPDGLDIEVFSKKCLEETFKRAKKDFDKEHVTTYIRSSKKFKTINYKK